MGESDESRLDTAEPAGSADRAPGEPAKPKESAEPAATGEAEENEGAAAGKKDRAAKKKRSGLLETLAYVLGGVVVALLVHTFLLQSFWIPSESMQNTLLVNDYVVVNKLAYKFGPVERGDIVVFKGWNGEDTIKRVIGVGGDHVKCCDAKQRITVNGTPLDEDKYLYPGAKPSDREFDITVPKGRLWLMGDHRNNSADSRFYTDDGHQGTISEDDVTGRAFLRYWPLNRISILSRPGTFSAVR
ncbi:signal peptidase I [Microbispora sp. SCL1-1]|uniref:signal peptidase I n=1 Tax=unclassified Microbispora TaxID=2614687 RepID=UPI001157F510|nr:signal peptidase I [Microbispora sp. SCL1-1]NJP28054.1 signal peptidase I [Microbispora sp. CL1-1]TQS09418.1 signal peptidase I [Microbispora sp. SCL1-1]